MSPFMYFAGPLAVAFLLQYILTLISPRQSNESQESERDKSSKPARKGDAESGIVDSGSVVAREHARQAERQPAAVHAVEPDAFDVPDDFSMEEYRSARD